MARPESKYAGFNPEHVSRIVACAHSATSAEWQAGILWYPLYGAMVAREGTPYGYTATQSCYIFASLSPQMPVVRNLRMYRQTLADGHAGNTGQTGRNRANCEAIMAGRLEALSGDKVTRFGRNLAGEMHPATVDRHAVSVAHGVMLDGVPGNAPGYAHVERAYQVAAAVLGVTTAACQAITWIAWRRAKGLIDKHDAAMFANPTDEVCRAIIAADALLAAARKP